MLDTESHSFKNKQNRHIYVEVKRNSKGPWLLFLNGLSDSMETWKGVCSFLGDSHSLLFIDLPGQGKSAQVELCNPENNYHFTAHEQAENVNLVLESLMIPSVHRILGFSYGGGVAVAFAELFHYKCQGLILFLPYAIRLDHAFPLQRLMDQQWKQFKKFTPFQKTAEVLEHSYKKFVLNYMHYRFSNRIPKFEERKMAIELTEGIMEFNSLKVLPTLPQLPIDLISSDRDTLIPRTLYQEFWDQIQVHSKRTWLKVTDGEHLLLEQRPLFCARWIQYLLQLDKKANHSYPELHSKFSYNVSEM